MAYKEVNFKSKLIEWTQKNKVDISFELLEQGSENDGTPTFSSQVFLQGIQCGTGKGYSKKESQQLAAKETLELLKKTGFTHKILNARTPQSVTEKTETENNAETPATLPTTDSVVQEITEAIEDISLTPSDTTSSTKGRNKKPTKEEIVEAAERAAFEA